MLAAQRKARILEEVGTSGARRISDLAAALEVSEVTIRRDVEALAAQGLVDKVHGGVTANALSSTVEPPFAANSMKDRRSKDPDRLSGWKYRGRGFLPVQSGHCFHGNPWHGPRVWL
jgi:DeoR/GlpR family transcriptional regulator of sugar metabolism